MVVVVSCFNDSTSEKNERRRRKSGKALNKDNEMKLVAYVLAVVA